MTIFISGAPAGVAVPVQGGRELEPGRVVLEVAVVYEDEAGVGEEAGQGLGPAQGGQLDGREQKDQVWGIKIH